MACMMKSGKSLAAPQSVLARAGLVTGTASNQRGLDGHRRPGRSLLGLAARVNVLGVASGWPQKELVERCRCERPTLLEHRVREQLDEGAADHQVLLGLRIFDPRELRVTIR